MTSDLGPVLQCKRCGEQIARSTILPEYWVHLEDCVHLEPYLDQESFDHQAVPDYVVTTCRED